MNQLQSNRHTHNHCEHNLKLCVNCDIVHCTKCFKEWSTPKNIAVSDGTIGPWGGMGGSGLSPAITLCAGGGVGTQFMYECRSNHHE